MRAVLEIRHREADTRWSREIYDKIYSTMQIRHLDSFYQWLLDILNVQPGRLFLDVSCGVGALPRLATQRGLRAYGVDFSEVALKIAYRETPTVSWILADGERLPFPDSCFDYVTHIGSLEHYVCPEMGAREVARVLKPDGCACILLPNTFGLLGNVWTALRTGRTFDDGQPIQRYAARLEWQELLEVSGLIVIRTIKYERAWPRNLADVRWYLRHPKDILRLFLGYFVPLNLANYFVYLCRKAGDVC
jgi:SAM-dependent methyltransferase